MILELLPRRLVREVANVHAQVAPRSAATEASAARDDVAAMPPPGQVSAITLPHHSTSPPTYAIAAVATAALTILPDENLTSHELRVVELLDGPVRAVGTRVLDDAASLGPAIVHRHDLGPDDVASSAHVILKVLPRDLVRQVAHVHPVGRVSHPSSSPSSTASGCGRDVNVTSHSRATVGGTHALPVLPDEYLTSHEFRIVQPNDGGIRLLDRGVFDDAASPRSAIVSHEHVGARHVPCAIRSHVCLSFALKALVVASMTSSALEYPMSRNSASGPEIGLPGQISAGF